MKLSVWTEKSKATNRYSVRYWDPDSGLKQRIQCLTREQMLATKSRIQSMLLNRHSGRGDPDAIPLVVFEEYLTAIGFAGRRASTIAMKQKNVIPFLETLFKLSQLSPESIKAYVKNMNEKYKPDTVAIRLRDLRAFINWCVKENRLKESPFRGISIPTSNFSGRKITALEVASIYKNVSGMFRVFFTLAMETGARHGELLGAEWHEIDLQHRSWLIPALKCKTRITRTIPLSDHAVKALESLSKGGNRVFEPLNRFKVQRLWKQALRASGVTGRVRIHDIRHTFASNWRGRAASLKAIAGWTTDAMMSKYTHTELPQLAEELQKTSDNFWGEFGANVPNSETIPKHTHVDKS